MQQAFYIRSYSEHLSTLKPLGNNASLCLFQLQGLHWEIDTTSGRSNQAWLHDFARSDFNIASGSVSAHSQRQGTKITKIQPPQPNQSVTQQDVLLSPITNVITKNTNATDRPFECPYCGRRFKRKGHIENHIRLHTGDRPYVCDLCGIGFAQDSGLRYHKVSNCAALTLPLVGPQADPLT